MCRRRRGAGYRRVGGPRRRWHRQTRRRRCCGSREFGRLRGGCRWFNTLLPCERWTDRFRANGARRRRCGRSRSHRRFGRFVDHRCGSIAVGRNWLCLGSKRYRFGPRRSLDGNVRFDTCWGRWRLSGIVAEVLPDLVNNIVIQRAGMRKLLAEPQLWEHIQDFFGLHFELPRQLINSNLLHKRDC